MDGKTVQSAYRLYFFVAIFCVLSVKYVNMELAAFHVSEGFPFTENQASEGTPFARQTSSSRNATLNQLAENLNRMEGNLASLIQSFLALQRSVFNLEQLQELLVLLLEDILKQTGNMDQGGVVNNRGNPTSSVSNESLDMEEDNGVDSAEIDEVGEDTDTTDDRGGDGGDNGEAKDKGGGAGGGDEDQGADPFGVLNDMNIPATLSRNQPPQHGENNRLPLASAANNVRKSEESADHSSEMVGSESKETSRVFHRTNNVEPKPTSSFTQESDAPRKPQVTEPLVTFAAQLEARLYDMMRRLSHEHGSQNNYDQRMALMREADSSPSLPTLGESPMAPPPRFEPLEIVAANDAMPIKRLADASPVKVKLQRQMSPIISHGGPLVGPEDFSSPFMETWSGGAKVSGESLNERSTGMINNMVQIGRPGTPTSSNTSPSFPSRPETLPSIMDRERRQAKVGQATLNNSSRFTNSTFLAHEDNATVHITFGNFSSDNNNKSTTSNPQSINSKIFDFGKNSSLLPQRTTNDALASDAHFDTLIANLLHDLSQHLNQQYLRNKHDASLGKDIDTTVLELNNLIWITSHTSNISLIHSKTNSKNDSDNAVKTHYVTPTDPTTQRNSSHGMKEKDNVIQTQLVEKIRPDTLKNEKSQIATQQKSKSIWKAKDKYVLAGAKMDESTSGHNDSTTPILDKGYSVVSVSNNDSMANSSKVQKDFAHDSNIVSKSKQWEWLRLLPLGDQENNVNLNRLIDTLSSLTHLIQFSDELKSFSARGIQLTKSINKDIGQSQTTEITTSRQETDSSGESIENDNADINSSEDGLEESGEDVDRRYEVTTPKDDKKGPDSMANMQNPKITLGRLDKKLTDTKTNDGKSDATSNKEGSQDSDEDDSNNATEEQGHDDNVIDGIDESHDVDTSDETGSEETFDKDDHNNESDEQDNDKEEGEYENETEGNLLSQEAEDIIDKDYSASNEEQLVDQQKQQEQELPDDIENIIETVIKPNQPYDNPNDNDDNEVKSNEEDNEDFDNDSGEESKDVSEERINTERKEDAYFVTDLTTKETQVLVPPGQYDDIIAQVFSNQLHSPLMGGKHKINKRSTQHSRRRILSSFLRKSKSLDRNHHSSHRIVKRQVIPTFWQFLYGNTPESRPQPGLGQNPFSFQSSLQDPDTLNSQFGTSSFANPHFGLSPLNNVRHEQTSLHNTYLGQSLLDNSQLGQSHLHNTETGQFPQQNTELGQSPLQNTPLGQSPQDNTQFGQSPLDNKQLGQSQLHNPQFGQSPLDNTPLGQSQLHNPQFGQSPLDNTPLGQSQLHNPQFGQSLDNSPLGQSQLHNPQFGQSPQDNTQLGQSPLHNTQLGQSSNDNPHLGQSLRQRPNKNSFRFLNHQQRNIFGSPPLSRNFPFHPPIGGYPQYYGYRGFQFPQFGYPGQPGSNYEPGESPAAEAAADMEEVLTNLFQRYWENVRNLFTTPGPSTTPEYEYEGPITTTTASPAIVPAATTASMITTKTPPKMTRVTTPKNTTTTIQQPTTTAAPLNTTMNSVPNANVTKILDPPNLFNNTNVNSTTISIANQSQNSSSVANLTSVASITTSLPQVTHVTTPNPRPQRGNTIFFNLIKSLEMMTHKPTI